MNNTIASPDTTTNLLNTLPIEILWDVFEHLLPGWVGLTHKRLCTLRSLSRTDQLTRERVNAYVDLKNTYLDEQLQDLKNNVFYPGRDGATRALSEEANAADMDAEGDEGDEGDEGEEGDEEMDQQEEDEYDEDEEEEDDPEFEFEMEVNAMYARIESTMANEDELLTQIIVDDCPCCFRWLCDRIPSLTPLGCVKDGWTFLSLAVCAEAPQMTRYILKSIHETPGFSPIDYIFSGANVTANFPTTIGLSTRGHQLAIFRILFDLSERLLGRDRLRGELGFALTDEDGFNLCSTASPDLANHIQEGTQCLDMQRLSGGSTAYQFIPTKRMWSAACFNPHGVEFLDFLHKYWGNAADINHQCKYHGSPLQIAVYTGRLDLVIWLKDHGADLRTGMVYTIAHDAADLASAESEAILAQLLPECQFDLVENWKSAALLLECLLDGTDFAITRAKIDPNNNLATRALLRHEYEMRAVRKCKQILSLFAEISSKQVIPSERIKFDTIIEDFRRDVGKQAREYEYHRLADTLTVRDNYFPLKRRFSEISLTCSSAVWAESPKQRYY
ncbi:hypothetical protein N7462_007307 [Penicillium macrosclerotiorum]|uniref:uncharacterized protein n=1 Tax=Penicillium macrosclerotiorum TaxID=303699 RepID=UPI0025497911|nr:uncharacterized protein N7462_007307 [Penicillium macrosclerotiorum]KAJ5679063.1 hypothetical protein N7462_007307 [Penicillium macrosclerotiorum]